jgi:hypothetical protein
VAVTAAEPVPVTIKPPVCGTKDASAPHRSQYTVATPRAAKDTFASVYPYVGFGEKTAAAHATVLVVNLIAALTLALVSTPPGALVESTSTTVDPSTCEGGDLDGEGVKDGVPDVDGVPEGVPDEVDVRDGVPDVDGVPDRVPLTLGVALGVCVGLAPVDHDAVGLAVLVDVSVALGVERADAVVDGDAPLETDRVGVAVRDGVVAGVGV